MATASQWSPLHEPPVPATRRPNTSPTPYIRPSTPSLESSLNNIDHSRTYFIQLCERNAIAAIDELLTRIPNPVLQLGENATTPALVACIEASHLSLFEKLLWYGFPFEERYHKVGKAAVCWAAKNGGDVRILDLMEQFGWDVGKLNFFHPPALNHLSTTKWLIDRGASVNTRSTFNFSLIELASRSAPFSVISFLVEHGADLKEQGVIGLAAMGHNFGAPNRLEVVSYLLDAGAEIDAIAEKSWDYYGATKNGLEIAIEGGKSDMVELLLKRGAHPNMKNGETPIDPGKCKTH
ncbi:hypothetical protein G7Y89_g6852 [Cudoniella acicularis]|uniref:Ankyrin n=1 Tax=Cudoniella acicularis TaxID=354080 RepID=A0A8H4RKH5_9HELO|nr:hypothetical protein G7Y89_g6852 [Cudoniella acicularis]